MTVGRQTRSSKRTSSKNSKSFGSALRRLYKTPEPITFTRTRTFQDLGLDATAIGSLCHQEFDGKYLLTKYTDTQKSYFFYGMYRGPEQLGFAIVEEEDAKSYVIDYFCALKSYGKFLMRHIQQDLCGTNCTISLFSLSTAFKFYEKMGFIPMGHNIYMYKRS